MVQACVAGLDVDQTSLRVVYAFAGLIPKNQSCRAVRHSLVSLISFLFSGLGAHARLFYWAHEANERADSAVRSGCESARQPR